MWKGLCIWSPGSRSNSRGTIQVRPTWRQITESPTCATIVSFTWRSFGEMKKTFPFQSTFFLSKINSRSIIATTQLMTELYIVPRLLTEPLWSCSVPCSMPSLNPYCSAAASWSIEKWHTFQNTGSSTKNTGCWFTDVSFENDWIVSRKGPQDTDMQKEV